MEKLFLIMTLVFASSGSAFAQADFEKIIPSNIMRLDLITETNIKLVGRGVHLKGSNQGLVLSCLTPECLQLRFIYITKNRQAYYVGPTYDFEGSYDVGTSLSDEELKANSKAVLKEVLGRINHRRAGRGALLLFAGGILGGVLLPVAGPVPLILFMGTGGLIALSNDQTPILKDIDFMGGLQNKFVEKGRETRLFMDKDGWNWSVRPKKVSFDKFLDIQHALFGMQAALAE